MKAIVWAAVWSLAPLAGFGQHSGGGASQPGSLLSSGLPLVGPIPPLGNTMPGLRFRGHTADAGRRPGFAGFPFVWGGYGEAYAPEPIVAVVAQPAPAYVIVEQRQRETVRSEIREYGKGASGGPESAEEPPAFSIALQDGSVCFAAAVAVQGDAIVYVDLDGGQQRLAFDAIDRDATRRLNRAKGLDLRLPPPNR